MKKVDESQIIFGTIDGINGWSVPIIIDITEAVALIENYDPSNPLSPDNDTSREIARKILDALKAVMEE